MAITLKFSPQEDELLTRYCKLVRRTKSDVIRELVRGLEQKLPEETQETQEPSDCTEVLSGGWVIDRTGSGYCNYRGFYCEVHPYQDGVEKDGFEVCVNSQQKAFVQSRDINVAMMAAQKYVDRSLQ